jgi:N-acetylmuramoyl-L-alanine amidase
MTSLRASRFVSVHCNAGGGTGIETWVHDNANNYAVNFASAVQQRMVRSLGVTNRGVKRCPSQRQGQNIYVLDPVNISAWAILPEVMFMDRASDLEKLISASFRQSAGFAIANGIRNFLDSMPQ